MTKATENIVPAKTPEQWMVEVNNRDQKFVDLIIGLATGVLVVPALFLKTYLGVTDQPVAMFLDWRVYVSWLSLVAAISGGATFHYFSTHWVRLAWGKEAGFDFAQLQFLMRWTFRIMTGAFVLGLSFIGWFLLTV